MIVCNEREVCAGLRIDRDATAGSRRDGLADCQDDRQRRHQPVKSRQPR